jgi:hypothetical protein
MAAIHTYFTGDLVGFKAVTHVTRLEEHPDQVTSFISISELLFVQKKKNSSTCTLSPLSTGLAVSLQHNAAAPTRSDFIMASDLSNIVQAVGTASGQLSSTMEAPSSSISAAMSSATDALTADGSYGWLGLFGRTILAVLNLVTTVLYWAIRLTTITLPTILFTLFSTSWTVTMNATTL